MFRQEARDSQTLEEVNTLSLYLRPVYQAVYGRPFESKFEHRMEMQKAIYLLKEMGVPVGDYGFYWYLHGPYSQELQNDILSLPNQDNQFITFSNENKAAIDKLAQLLNERTEYASSNWAECVASLHYIKVNLLPKNATDEDIIKMLQEKKPHLSNSELNMKALKEVEQLFL